MNVMHRIVARKGSLGCNGVGICQHDFGKNYAPVLDPHYDADSEIYFGYRKKDTNLAALHVRLTWGLSAAGLSISGANV